MTIRHLHVKTTRFLRKLSIILMLLLPGFIFAQSGDPAKPDWSKMGDNPSFNFYQVQKDFYEYWAGKKIEKGKGYKPFKRWEAYMTPRVYPSGNMALPSMTYANFMDWRAKTSNDLEKSSSTGNWTELGPIGKPGGPGNQTGAGRLNFIRFDPNNSDRMFVGAPDGGLWQTTNGGASWTTNTDFLTIIGCSDLAIDPNNTQVMYLATGDLENDRRSIGVLKSIDGGATWNPTGLVWPASNGWKISKLLMHPTNSSIMILATNVGVFRTTDGWTTSDVTLANVNLKDMEFKPGDPNTIYTAGRTFWKSTDNGLNWTQITAGLPAEATVSRIALGVSTGNAAYVYALIGKSSDQSFLGLYRSTNSGTSFTLRSSSPNLLGYETDGSDSGGQAFYDLSIAIPAANAETVIVGGVNQWGSLDGGVTWSILSHWFGSMGVPFVHADVHELNYLPGSSTTLFSCNDGGLFKSTNSGSTWTDLSSNLSIAQQVKIGLSSTVAGTYIAGHQDNGTNLHTVGSWTNIFGGDGGECFPDYTNDNTLYWTYVQGDMYRSDDGGVTPISIVNGIPSGGASGADFYSPFHQDPTIPTKIYAGGRPQLYHSLDKGANWAVLGTPAGSDNIQDFAIAPSNNTIIYAVKLDAVSKSTNSGTTWTDITGTLPVNNASLSNVAISNTNPNIAWVTFSGYSDGEKVFKTINGGASWTNVSAGLPNLPMNTIVYVKQSPTDAVYVGADIGVYYLDNTLGAWTPFFTNLPNCAVRDLEIFYPTGKIRAGTYGRGTWESDLYMPMMAVTCPSNSAVCINAPAFALTGGMPAGGTYSGIGVSAGMFNPATAGVGMHTITYTNGGTCTFVITVNALPVMTCPANSAVCINAPAFSLTGGMPAGGTYSGTGVSAGMFNPATAGVGMHTITYSFTNANNCTNTCTFVITVNALPVMTCPANSAVNVNDPAFSLTGGMPAGGTYSGTGVSAGMFNPATAGVGMHTITYSFTNANNCTNTCTFIITVNAAPSVTCPSNSAVCINAAAFSLTGGMPAGGTYSGTGVSAGMFNPATAGVGMHTITYTNGGTCTFVITVNPLPVMTCPTNSTVNVNDPAFSLTGGMPVGGTYSGTGVSAGMFNPATAGVGMHTITYSFTNANNCTNTCTFIITVNAAPSVTCPANSAVCINAPAFALTGGMPAGGTYSGTGVSAGMFNPATAGVGMHTITYTNGGTCTFVITVNALPVMTCPANSAVCINAPAFSLTGGMPAGGTYSGTGVSAGMFNPATAGVGMHTITYSFTNANNCTNTCTFVITVNTLPTPSISGPSSVCSGGSVVLDAGAGYATYAWSNGGGTGQTATFSNILATTTYTVTVTNGNGCAGSASKTVVLQANELPSGWSNSNVGVANGTATANSCIGGNTEFEVTATGFSTSSSDVLHAAYQQLCGNSEVVARVVNVSGGGWGGVMIRETLSQGSKKVSLKTQLTTNIRREIRSVTNGATSILNFSRPQHTWLRLTRSGNNFVAYTSMDGMNWSFAFSATVSMNGCVYVGIFSESTNNVVTNTATFDNVSITGAPLPLADTFNPLPIAESSDQVQLYPNPTTGELNINLNVLAGKPGVVQIFNTFGELVTQERLVVGEVEPLHTCIIGNSGVYTVVIQLDDRRIVRRVVLNPGNGK